MVLQLCNNSAFSSVKQGRQTFCTAGRPRYTSTGDSMAAADGLLGCPGPLLTRAPYRWGAWLPRNPAFHSACRAPQWLSLTQRASPWVFQARHPGRAGQTAEKIAQVLLWVWIPLWSMWSNSLRSSCRKKFRLLAFKKSGRAQSLVRPIGALPPLNGHRSVRGCARGCAWKKGDPGQTFWRKEHWDTMTNWTWSLLGDLRWPCRGCASG